MILTEARWVSSPEVSNDLQPPLPSRRVHSNASTRHPLIVLDLTLHETKTQTERETPRRHPESNQNPRVDSTPMSQLAHLWPPVVSIAARRSSRCPRWPFASQARRRPPRQGSRHRQERRRGSVPSGADVLVCRRCPSHSRRRQTRRVCTRLACSCQELHATHVAEVAKTSDGPVSGAQIARILANSATGHAKHVRRSAPQSGRAPVARTTSPATLVSVRE